MSDAPQTSCRYRIHIEGVSPLILNAIPHHDYSPLVEWRKQHPLESTDIAFDDRHPPWAWRYCLYPWNDLQHDVLYVPAFVLFASFRSAVSILAKRRRDFSLHKKIAHCHIDERRIPIVIDGRHVRYEDLFVDVDYDKQKEVAAAWGITLFETYVSSGGKRGLRVRPRIDNWQLNFTLTVHNAELPRKDLMEIVAVAGMESGICDWRPGSPKARGSFGKFVGEVEAL